MGETTDVTTLLKTLPGDLSFSVWALVAGLVFGTLGWWIFRHGKRNQNPRNIYSGLTLMIYPYFITNTLLSWLIGIALCGYVYYYWEQ